MLFEGADPACISALEDWFACVNPTSCEELAEGCNAEALARGQACDEGDTDGSASSTGVDTVGGTDTGGTTG
jgi:hypothetical protein